MLSDSPVPKPPSFLKRKKSTPTPTDAEIKDTRFYTDTVRGMIATRIPTPVFLDGIRRPIKKRPEGVAPSRIDGAGSYFASRYQQDGGVQSGADRLSQTLRGFPKPVPIPAEGASSSAIGTSIQEKRSTQISKLVRTHRPIINPLDYVVPFKQTSSIRELLDRYSYYIESMNRIYQCSHCGLSYRSIENYKWYGCSMHPGIPIFDCSTGKQQYTCCGKEYNDRGLGCVPCMHSRSVTSRKKIVLEKQLVYLPEELVDAAIAGNGCIFAGKPTSVMLSLAYMSSSPHYTLPEAFFIELNPQFIIMREAEKCYFSTNLMSQHRKSNATRGAQRSVLK